ncbi:MAG: DNA-binding transcriptional LysR family regulator [Marinobacter psychrophilus]
MLNLHLMRIFYTVVQEGSFSGAATVLHISQPAVSQGVRELESQLGLTLVDRMQSRKSQHSQKVQLTAGGSAVFDHARGIFALEKAAVDDIEARVGAHIGNLTLGASTTVAGYWLPAAIAEFARRYPNINMKVRVANTRVISEWLLDCQLDLAIVEGDVEDPRIESRHWRDEGLLLVAGTEWAQGEGALERMNSGCWVQREEGSGTRSVCDRLLASLGIIPKTTLQIASNEGIARCVTNGMGFALLPRVVINELLELERLQEVALPGAEQLSRSLCELRFRDRPLSPSAQAFADILHNKA